MDTRSARRRSPAPSPRSGSLAATDALPLPLPLTLRWHCRWHACSQSPAAGRARTERRAQGRELPQLEIVLARDVVGLAHRGKGLGLLDRVDAEVGLEVELEVEHVGRIPGLLGDDRQHLVRNGIARWHCRWHCALALARWHWRWHCLHWRWHWHWRWHCTDSPAPGPSPAGSDPRPPAPARHSRLHPPPSGRSALDPRFASRNPSPGEPVDVRPGSGPSAPGTC